MTFFLPEIAGQEGETKGTRTANEQLLSPSPTVQGSWANSVLFTLTVSKMLPFQ